MPPKVTTSIRLDADLKKAAEAAAIKDRRTLTSLIEKLLSDHIEKVAKDV